MIWSSYQTRRFSLMWIGCGNCFSLTIRSSVDRAIGTFLTIGFLSSEALRARAAVMREQTDFFRSPVGGCRKQVSIADGCRRSYPLPVEVNLPSLALSALCGFGRPF